MAITTGALLGIAAASSALSAGGSMISAGIKNKKSWKYTKKAMALQDEYNRQAADTAFERQKEFYNQERDWNDPSNVRERYEAAGLNPNSAFGTAGSYTPQQAPDHVAPSQAPSAPFVDAQGFSFTNPIQEALQLAQVRNIEANTAKIESETGDRGEFLRGQKLANDLQESGLISLELRNGLDALNLQFKNEVYDTEVSIRKQTADNMAKQYEQMNQQIFESVSRIELNDEQKKQIQSLVLLNNANAAFANARADWHGKLSQAQIDEWEQFTRNLEGENQHLAVKVANEYLRGSGIDFENQLKKLAIDWTNPEKGVKISSEVIGMLKDVAFGIFMGKRAFR